MSKTTGRVAASAAVLMLRLALTITMATTLAACGGGGSGGGGGGVVNPPTDPGVAGAPYFTFAVGDRWRALERGNTVNTTRVLRQDAAGLVLREESSAGSVDDYQVARTDSAFSFVPLPTSDALTQAIGRYDIARFPLRVGASYTALDRAINGSFDIDGDGRADNLQVRIEVTVVGFERITVPAGTFDNALRQRTVITQTVALGGSGFTVTVTGTSDDWYAQGVGPVRSVLVTETNGQRETVEEVLQDYRVGTLSNDTVAPTVASRSPAEGSVGNLADVVLRFSEAVERASVPATALQVRDASNRVILGSTQFRDDRTIAFVPEGFGSFTDGSYTVTLNATPEDWAGNRLAGTASWGFRLDRGGPVLVSRLPENNARDVALDTAITFTFDEALDPASVVPSRVFFNCGGGSALPVSVRAEGRTLTLVPAAPLPRGLQCTASTGFPLRDTLGNNALTSWEITFTTDPGRFALPVAVPALEGFRVQQFVQADLNGDGRSEVLVVAQPPSGGFGAQTQLLRRNGDGSLSAQATQIAGFNCAGNLLVLDVDRDGRPDLVSAAPFCGLQWQRQRDDGTFALPVQLDNAEPGAVKPINLTGSTREGLVYTAGASANSLRLLPPEGSSGFGTPRTVYSSAAASIGFLVADLNGDGRADLLIVDTINGNRTLVVARQRADAAFDIVEQRLIPGLRLLAAADLTGDGRVDLVFGEPAPSRRLLLQRQSAQGSFPDDGEAFTLPGRPRLAQLTDVDGDGRADLTVTIDDDSSTLVNFVTLARRTDGGFQLTPLLEFTRDVTGLDQTDAFLIDDFNGDGRRDILHGRALIFGRTAVAAPAAAPGGAVRLGIPRPALAPGSLLRQ